jgi:cell division protein FtsA
MAGKFILGVDIGTSAVKALAAAKENGHIRILGNGTVPCAGFAKGVVTAAAALAAAIREAVDCAAQAAALPREAVHLGIGGLDITAQNGIGSIAPSGGLVTGAEIERACRAAAAVALPEDQRILHSLPIGYWLDGHPESDAPIGGNCGRLEVETHIVSAPAPVIDELIDSLAAQRIAVASVCSNAVVGAQTLVDSDSCLIIDMGAGLTGLALYTGGKIVLSASVPLGGDYITGDIMHGLDVGRLHAEEIKRYYAKLDKNLHGRDVVLDLSGHGTTDKQVRYDFLQTIVESRVEEIVSLLHAYVEPALSRYGAGKILLTGGASLLPSLGDWIGRTFVRPVVPVKPGGDIAPEYAHPSFAACFGLVAHATRHAPVSRANNGLLRTILDKFKNFI